MLLLSRPLATTAKMNILGHFECNRVEKRAHRVGGNLKRYQQSTNADQKSIETVLLIAICGQCGNKW